MVNLRINCETTAPPEMVLDTARETTPERRHRFWTNVTPKYFTLHDSGADFIEVTEGTFVAGRFWERSRYEWPDAGRITATVLDSNVFKPGSTFELRAAERDGRTAVEMLIRREFQPGVKGRIASLVNHSIGRIYFDRYLRSVLRRAEEERTPSSLG